MIQDSDTEVEVVGAEDEGSVIMGRLLVFFNAKYDQMMPVDDLNRVFGVELANSVKEFCSSWFIRGLSISTSELNRLGVHIKGRDK